MKIAIIGAGITGLYLAWKLAEKNHEVTVFDKKAKIGKEVCSGLFSERILDFIPQSENLIQSQIRSVLIHFTKRTLKIDFTRKFFVINHSDLDNLVAELTKNSGATILLNNPIQQNKHTFNLSDRKFERIIGCDGALSQVRNILNLPSPQFSLGIQGFLSKEDFSNFVETWPTKSKSGFIWKIPRGKEVEWGIVEKPKIAKKIFEKFLRKNNIHLEKIQSWLIPQGLIIPKNSQITLCGDAAGLTKPWSGGGVIWGLTAADILLKNFPDFLKYRKEIKKFFLPKITLGKIAKDLVYFFGFKFPWVFPKKIKIESDFLI